MTEPFDPIAQSALAGLREPAPAGLAHATLVAVGLADDYSVMDSPVGPLRVAWNGRGVSAVEEAPDDGTFEARLFARTGRVARRRAAGRGGGGRAGGGPREGAPSNPRLFAGPGRAAGRRKAPPLELSGKSERRRAGDRHNKIDLDLRGSTAFERAVWMKAL